MLGRIMLALLIVPILEIWVMSKVAGIIGWPETLLIVLTVSVIGAWLVRSQGAFAWRRIQDAIQQAKSPTKELVDGALIVFGATLLLTPGFLTDFAGLAMLVPVTRAPVRNRIIARSGDRARAITREYTDAKLGQFFTTSVRWQGPVVDTDGREADAAETVVVHRVDQTPPALQDRTSGPQDATHGDGAQRPGPDETR